MAVEKESERETTTVVMGRELAAMVRTIAAHRNITMADAWDKYGRNAISKEYQRVLNEMQSLVAGEAGA